MVIGTVLRGLRADPARSPLAGSGFDAPATITVTSPAFADGGPISRRHASKGVERLPEDEFHTGAEGIRVVPTMLGKHGYSGPRPIPGHGAHRYRFHVLALDRQVPEDATSVKAVLTAASGHALARGNLTGTYER
jgi:phosphatidylethanolamine-binding protein (PEBP) family uncharacterized protein